MGCKPKSYSPPSGALKSLTKGVPNMQDEKAVKKFNHEKYLLLKKRNEALMKSHSFNIGYLDEQVRETYEELLRDGYSTEQITEIITALKQNLEEERSEHIHGKRGNIGVDSEQYLKAEIFAAGEALNNRRSQESIHKVSKMRPKEALKET
jgi:hypothetical protein